MNRIVHFEISECWKCPWHTSTGLYCSEGSRACSHPENGTKKKDTFHTNRIICDFDFLPDFSSWCPLAEVK
jgi:hypothetical protein